MPVLRSAQRGDLYVELAVETPVKLTKQQKELLRQLKGMSTAGTPAGSGNLPVPAERVLEPQRPGLSSAAACPKAHP